ncbi:LRP chaperone MESD [Camelus dromedarius]|uniref:LRP chaperone MESD n=1 Tax=Camelus dromedarius TaxID=9838 RepID=A0A5N4DKH3_CAMDR|nr:LRP chaperone MESD [Camelus dromedarius]
MLKVTKKGKILMMFVTVSGSPKEKETEEITSLWHGSLFNATYDVQRLLVGSERAIVMLRDGSCAWESKGFLVSQDRYPWFHAWIKQDHQKEGYEAPLLEDLETCID